METAPAAGTFFSLQLDLPPYPFNPFPGHDLYAFTTAPDTFYVDDLLVDYSTLQGLPGLGVAYDVAVPDGLTAADVTQLSASSGGRRFLALMSVPPSLPGNGGGGGTNQTNVVMLAFQGGRRDDLASRPTGPTPSARTATSSTCTATT